MKKDLVREKIVDEKLDNVQGGFAFGWTIVYITCLQCGKEISGLEQEAAQAQQEHTRVTGHTSFSKKTCHG